MKTITVPVSIGELIDKITILEIKIERLTDEEKRKRVKHEHHLLMQVLVRHKIPIHDSPLLQWSKELHDANKVIWNAEDELRKCELKRDFGESFQTAAQNAFTYNGKRYAVKQAINAYFNSDITEEKQYG
jgi:hypothetical protein